ncbi:MAG: hypothetical protein IPL79_20025 [Myxococcales bacterium]|nr:hypothetical protein [Myxococcales bacterium]
MSNYDMDIGYHRARVGEVKLIPRKDGKEPIGKIMFRNADGKIASYSRPLSPKALPYFVEALRKCGWTGNDLFDLASCTGAELDAVLPLETQVTVEDEVNPNNGEVRREVKWVGEASMSPAQREAMAAWSRSVIQTVASVGGPLVAPAKKRTAKTTATASLDKIIEDSSGFVRKGPGTDFLEDE